MLDPSSLLPLRDIPGDYGVPLLGPVLDRLNYFWFQGRDPFFSTLVHRHRSTVVRVNMPPGPPFFPDSRSIMLLDQKSYGVLFDLSKIEKRDVFIGTYMPSTDFTGGFRVLPYLDPSEKNHAPLKNFCFEILKSNAGKWIPEFRNAFREGFTAWNSQIARTGKADFVDVTAHFTLNFLLRSVLDADPSGPGEASLGNDGPSCVQSWLALQLHPQASFGLSPLLEEIILRSFPLPYELIASKHQRLCRFFNTYGNKVLDMAVYKFGLDREEALHNLMFFLCFNTWGGAQILLPSIVRRIGEAGRGLQRELSEEVRGILEEEGGEVTMRSLERMELVKSTVYEVLRIDPPVPFQYGRAKKDFTLCSHDYAYMVRKGELLGGYLGMVMKDPKVFTAPQSFNAKRFMGKEGKELLNYLVWSNGPETRDPTIHDKQCPGKDFVNFLARLLVVEFFLAYDFYEVAPTRKQDLRASLEFTYMKRRRAPKSKTLIRP